jgi:hypothetical protein
MTLVTILVIALAELAYNRRVWRPRQARDPSHADGLNATEASVPLVTLAAARQDRLGEARTAIPLPCTS